MATAASIPGPASVDSLAETAAETIPPVTVHACALGCSLQHIKAISFDLDDTLWDNKDVLALASKAGEDWLLKSQPGLADVLAARSISARMMAMHKTRTDIAHCYTALRKAAMYEALQEGGVPAALRDGVVRDGMAAYTEARSAVTLWPGVRDTLQALAQRGYTLVALTNGNVAVDLVPDLDGVFVAYVSPAEAGCAKPEKRPFELACEAAGAPAERVLHVGDSWDHDVQGAVSAGLSAVWLDMNAEHKSAAEAEQLNCNASMSHIAGLLQLLPEKAPA